MCSCLAAVILNEPLNTSVHVTQVVHIGHEARAAVFYQPHGESIIQWLGAAQVRPYYSQLYDMKHNINDMIDQ